MSVFFNFSKEVLNFLLKDELNIGRSSRARVLDEAALLSNDLNT